LVAVAGKGVELALEWTAEGGCPHIGLVVAQNWSTKRTEVTGRGIFRYETDFDHHAPRMELRGVSDDLLREFEHGERWK
jgi:hypothetical protein